jgi:hypothetical protein
MLAARWSPPAADCTRDLALRLPTHQPMATGWRLSSLRAGLLVLPELLEGHQADVAEHPRQREAGVDVA